MRFLLIIFSVFLACFASAEIDRKEVFSALSGSDVVKMEAELAKLDKSASGDEAKAFKGALLMKMSSFEKTPKAKLTKFNKGKLFLEESIKSNPNNSEFRFLRLMIQENAPKQLKYHSDLEQDAKKILADFSTLKAATKDAISSYSKKSAYLKGL